MATIVLIHGSFHGGWCWDEVAAKLRRRGHEVIAPTLPGLELDFGGDPREIDLTTHIRFMDRLIDRANRRTAVLVGHSYAGFLLPAVSLGCKGVLYTDAFLPRCGETAFQLLGAMGSSLRAVAEARADYTIPPPPAEAFGLKGSKGKRIEARLRPMPARTHDAPAPIDALEKTLPPSAFVRSTRFDGFAQAEARAAEAGWPVHTLPVGHDAMLLAPRRLSAIIAKFANSL